jgi:hypothetical protein
MVQGREVDLSPRMPSLKPIVPIARFTIRLSRERGSVRVVVWRTLADLKAAYRRLPGARPTRHLYGCCRSYERRYRNGRRAPDFAEVHLAQGYLGTTVLSHEFTHAALAWARTQKISGDDLVGESDGAEVSENEERFCDVLSDLMAQCVIKLRALALIE